MKERDIHYICFHFILNGQDYADDMGQSVPPEELYQKMVDGAETKTSQVSMAAFVEEKFPNLQEKIRIYPIGATIGSHTGPGTLALFFWGDKR